MIPTRWILCAMMNNGRLSMSFLFYPSLYDQLFDSLYTCASVCDIWVGPGVYDHLL